MTNIIQFNQDQVGAHHYWITLNGQSTDGIVKQIDHNVLHNCIKRSIELDPLHTCRGSSEEIFCSLQTDFIANANRNIDEVQN